MSSNDEKSKIFDRIPPEADKALARAIAFSKDLDDHKIDKELARRACLDGDLDAIDSLCEYLLQKRKERERQAADGLGAPVVQHGHLPERIIRELAHSMLSSCTRNGEPSPASLVELIGHLLDQKETKRDAPRSFSAMFRVAENRLRNPDASTREIARLSGVHPRTVARWNSDPSYNRLLEILRVAL